ncbi:salicylate synthase [Burkholderia singularis]|uniref:Salicylate synthase n=1 Tax=Burkholderia singularis TaxID=1503053 RepID=A0A103DXF6_9BURK|nr:salicylate synthase [Burkholderia singularis]KVE24482.1 salicylate synthase [Burkholderia singularis]
MTNGILVEKSPLPKSRVLPLIEALLNHYANEDQYVYERGPCWYVGIGAKASLMIDSDGRQATIFANGETQSVAVNGTLAETARTFLSRHGPPAARIFGQAGFNYAAHVNGHPYRPGRWPLLALMLPHKEVVFDGNSATIYTVDQATAQEIQALMTARAKEMPSGGLSVDASANAADYEDRVSRALIEIGNGAYAKVIIARSIELESEIDMPATLRHGRASNSPARSFLLKHGQFEAIGFSPELVTLVENGVVTTEPLAGTRSALGTDEEIAARRNELLNDPKEIVEHVLSVRAAIEELDEICVAGTVSVNDFMSIRQRGSVQHLGSRVSGRLACGKDAWDAFDTLFPSITASGIPKKLALHAIERLEDTPRELYAGAVLLLEGHGMFEAALVLRSVFQDKSRRWLQAGAGIIAQSRPERELAETNEKLASIAPYLVARTRAEAVGTSISRSSA